MIMNPFTYGDPISDPKRFFGRQLEIEQVFSRLRNSEFESSSLVGERRVGKTSLLNYLAHPDVRRAHGLDPDKYLFVYVDLQMVDKDTTSTRLWQRLLRQTAKCCYDDGVKQILEEVRHTESIDTFALADLFDSIDEKDKYIVFLLDEFENVTENANFDSSFFYGLRSLAIHHNLSFITSSCHELIDLCHSGDIRSSPFFNIFANINIPLFNKNEAQNLISQLLAGTGVTFTDAENALIFGIAGCHPYFLQAACSFLFDAHAMKLDPVERVSFLRKEFREEASPHMANYWQNSDEQEKIVLTVLTLLERQRGTNGPHFSVKQLQDLYAHSNQTLARLEKRALVASGGDTYSLFNASLGEWIFNEITNTGNDQQSYDEWLKSGNGIVERFAAGARKELGEVLPEISNNYRELIIHWISDPKTLMAGVGLLKIALGLLG